MIIPIRCWSCGKPLAHLWSTYQEKTSEGANRKEVLDNLGLERYCCRAIMMGHVELLELSSHFRKA